MIEYFQQKYIFSKNTDFFYFDLQLKNFWLEKSKIGLHNFVRNSMQIPKLSLFLF